LGPAKPDRKGKFFNSPNFTPLEKPAIHGGDDINKTSIPHRKGGVKATSFLTGFTSFYEKLHRLLFFQIEGKVFPKK
jgi:hypothetical protein